MKTKRILGFLLMVAIITTVCVLATMAVSAVGTMEVAHDDTNTNYGWKTKTIPASVTDIQTDVPATAAGIKLYVDDESLDLNSFPMAGYAIDGKWKIATSIADKDLKALFNKGGVLQITDKMSEKAKDGAAKAITNKPAGENEDSGYVVIFKAVKPRPAAPKYVVNYTVGKDDTFASNGTWTLAKKETPLVELTVGSLSELNYGIPANGKKLADDEKLTTQFAATAVLSAGDNGAGKAGGKTVYFVQIKPNPTTFTPASKPLKVNVSAALKAPKLKPDYKSNNIKVKSGLAVNLGSGYTLYEKTPVSGRSVAVPTKEQMPSLITTATGVQTVSSITVATFATAKKPASLVATITVATQAAAPADGITVDEKGKMNIASTLETRPSPFVATDKWGKVKVTPGTNVTFLARVKSTAKQGKPDDTTNTSIATGEASSPYKTVTINWGAAVDGKYPDVTVTMS